MVMTLAIGIMGPKFQIIDSNNVRYSVQNITNEGHRLYSINNLNGHYAEISYNGAVWTEMWNSAFIPPFVYDLHLIGNLIKDHEGF